MFAARCAIASAIATCVACQQHGDHYQSRAQDCYNWTTDARQPATAGTVAARGAELACAGYVPRASLEQMLQH